MSTSPRSPGAGSVPLLGNLSKTSIDYITSSTKRNDRVGAGAERSAIQPRLSAIAPTDSRPNPHNNDREQYETPSAVTSPRSRSLTRAWAPGNTGSEAVRTLVAEIPNACPRAPKDGAGDIDIDIASHPLNHVSDMRRDALGKGAARGDMPSITHSSKGKDADRRAPGAIGGSDIGQREPSLSATNTSTATSTRADAARESEASPMSYHPGPVPSIRIDGRDADEHYPATAAHSSNGHNDDISSSTPTSTSPIPSRSSPSLDSLPHNVLSLIAYHIVTTSPSSHPGSLSAALASCKAFHYAASFESNPQLYHDLFSHTFDLAALRRRYDWMKRRLMQARLAAIANETAANAERSVKKAAEAAAKGAAASGSAGPDAGMGGSNGASNGPTPITAKYNGDTAAKPQSNGNGNKPTKSPAAMTAKQAFDLFGDPRSWAMDYKERWTTAKRMRLNVRMHSMVVPGTCDREDMMADLWNIWFLLTENDGKNLRFLAEQCHFVNWMSVYNDDMIQSDAATPGYPEESGAKALGTWIALMSGTDLVSEQSANQVDEKIFTLRPYVFACAKYEILYARWTLRHLPLASANGSTNVLAGGPGSAAQGPLASASGAAGVASPESTGPSKAVPYKRFGYTWRRAPPNHILGSYLYFLRLLDRQPNRRLSLSTPTPGVAAATSGLFNSSRILPSVYHDREWQRNSVCQDPSSSPGLPSLTFRGELEGYWRGKFLFYDFDMYRRVLAGDVRAVYTGKFAEQHLELELRETVVRVPIAQAGGDGPAVCAGFKEEAEGEMPDEIRRIREGYGFEVVDEHELQYEKEHGPQDEPGWTKEILLSGYGRTSWGMASIRGRVRAWDGMIVLQMAYSRQPMERWVWRGYLHTGGYLLGMWRDSFSPEHQRGYEGPFGIVRAGDVSYPAHLPVAMTTVPAQPPPTHGGPVSVQAQSAAAPTQTSAYNTGQANNVSQTTADPARADFGNQPAPATATTVDEDAPTTTDMGGMGDPGDTITNASVSAQAGASVLSASAGSSGSPTGSFSVPPALPVDGDEETGGSSGL